MTIAADRKSTRLNSSHTEIYTLSLHDALPILSMKVVPTERCDWSPPYKDATEKYSAQVRLSDDYRSRSEEHTSELQSHRDLHSFPTRRSSDLVDEGRPDRALRLVSSVQRRDRKVFGAGSA